MTQIIIYAILMFVVVICLGALSQWAVKYWENDE